MEIFEEKYEKGMFEIDVHIVHYLAEYINIVVHVGYMDSIAFKKFNVEIKKRYQRNFIQYAT